MSVRTRTSQFLLGLGFLLLFPSFPKAADLDASPILYATAKDNNPISKLQESLKSGKTQLRFDPGWGYLPSLLKALEVPVSSQMLVFSKTSLQRNRISPNTPRGLYFNDEIYLGFCHSGEVLEVSVADPQLGTAFYTLEQVKQKTPRF